MPHHPIINLSVLVVLWLSQHLLVVDAHSYVLESRRVSLGSFIGERGYTRGYGTYFTHLQSKCTLTLIAN